MADLVVILGVLAFVAVCTAYVVGCDRIIGPDATDSTDPALEQVDVPSVPGAR